MPSRRGGPRGAAPFSYAVAGKPLCPWPLQSGHSAVCSCQRPDSADLRLSLAGERRIVVYIAIRNFVISKTHAHEILWRRSCISQAIVLSKAEPGIVSRVTQNHTPRSTSRFKPSKTLPDEGRTDPFALVFGNHRNGTEAKPIVMGPIDRDGRERDVANQLIIAAGYQRNRQRTVCPEPIDDKRFRVIAVLHLRKRQRCDLTDHSLIVLLFGSQNHSVI